MNGDYTPPTVTGGMPVVIVRTKMDGGGTAYDAYVPLSSCENKSGCQYNWRGENYLRFEDATLPPLHEEMAAGWDRYDGYEAHRKASREVLLNLARSVYPELMDVDSLSELWHGDIHKESDVRVAIYHGDTSNYIS